MAAVITSTREFPPDGAPQFNGYRPGQVQEFPYKTPYDHGDRWQLSKLCAKLGIPHRDAERRAVLIQMLVTAEEAGKLDQGHALQLLAEIIQKSTRRPNANVPRPFVALEAPDINAVPAQPQAAPPSPESELWRFAKLPTKALIEEAGKLGLKFRGTAKREEVFAALEKHLKG